MRDPHHIPHQLRLALTPPCPLPGRVYADGDPAGFLLIYEDPEEDSFWVWRFMVDAKHQHNGIGRQAMGLLLERWRSLGVAAAALSVIPTNRETIAF